MSLLIGVLIGIVLIQLLNLYKKKADAKKKVEGSSSNERKPIEPYRWTPDGNAADAPSDFQLSGNAGVLNEEERTAVEAAEADEWPDKEARPAEEPAAAPAQAESLPEGERIDFNRASEVLGSVGEIRSMAEAGMILQRISGQAPLPYSTIDFGRRRYPQCISIIIEETDALRLVYMLQPLLTNELLAFVGTNQWLGEEKHAGAELVVGRGETQFDIVRLAQTDAANYDSSTEDIITGLKSIDARYGISIKAASSDSVGFALLNQPNDLHTFCEELYAFCPDLVDQGVGSLEALEQHIANTGYIELWWD
ncbi:DUF4253 domain-containing protein [Paenibacillus aurantius]|uniref:DUF4253 domain-containing protein n=1 Tax=Paenibacillus aurantius TaxID=2918900 RepID=A0AA96LFD1_9BACL|nr:DUF4253 domain-containing protein [Paenibacillus aurantius]WNQ11075.1 DUF4253 domain-containing protein [Paenibacillus aurantius]